MGRSANRVTDEGEQMENTLTSSRSNDPAIQDYYLVATNRLRDCFDSLLKPKWDAPQESRTVKLVTQGVKGHPYNIVRYGNLFWAVNWAEGGFEVDRFLAGEANKPIILGNSMEEVALGLDLMFPKKSSSDDKPTTTTSIFKSIGTNIFILGAEIFRSQEDPITAIPFYKNLSIPTTNLFEMGDGKPVTIISPAPARTCNYRCEYCYHHEHGFTKNAHAMESWCKSILTAVERIPRPLRLSAGAMGEPLIIPKWRETAYKILNHEHVQRLSFVSNLSQKLEEFFDNVDPTRIGVVASLHPSEFKDHDRDFHVFLEKITFLRDLGVSIVVNYVLTPDQLLRFEEYRSRINGVGVPMTMNILRGPYRGKVYPEAYTEEELKKVHECFKERPFIYDSQSHELNPYGSRCSSGRSGFYMEFDGSLYNCHFAFQRFGSVYDELLMVRAENGYCTATKCESQTTIGWREDVAKEYIMQGSLHHFIKR